MIEQGQSRELPFRYTRIDTDYVCIDSGRGRADLQAERRNGREKMI